jgi:hypothetical protein
VIKPKALRARRPCSLDGCSSELEYTKLNMWIEILTHENQGLHSSYFVRIQKFTFHIMPVYNHQHHLKCTPAFPWQHEHVIFVLHLLQVQTLVHKLKELMI